jgi:transposase
MDVLLEQRLKDAQEEVRRLQLENNLLREWLRLQLIKKYGPKSEALPLEQLRLLNEEPSVSAAEVAREAQLQAEGPAKASVPQPKKLQHPGRAELPAHLPRREEIIACPPEALVCPHCQKERSIISYEVSEELGVEPAVYFVRVKKREKRACHHCPEGGVVTAPVPAKIIPKGKLTDGLIIDTLLKKYDEHLPIYRQCAILERDAGVELGRQTLVDAIMAVGTLLRPVSASLAVELKAGGYIQADETPVPCQSERTVGRNHQAYLWEYSRPEGPVVFDFRMGRERDGPKEFLKGFTGTLQTDGYGAYNHLGSGIVYAGCMAHARREFYDAHRLAKEDPLPVEVLGQFAKLYKVEEEARLAKMSFEERLALRQQQSRPVMEALKERVLAIRAQVLPQSAMAKACQYALGQWTRLAVFLEDGRVEIDNNWCENAIRPIALGRKNWLHIGSEKAGPKIAAIASVMETCRRLAINVRDYFTDVLPKLPDWPVAQVAQLTPSSWKAARSHPARA